MQIPCSTWHRSCHTRSIHSSQWHMQNNNRRSKTNSHPLHMHWPSPHICRKAERSFQGTGDNPGFTNTCNQRSASDPGTVLWMQKRAPLYIVNTQRNIKEGWNGDFIPLSKGHTKTRRRTMWVVMRGGGVRHWFLYNITNIGSPSTLTGRPFSLHILPPPHCSRYILVLPKGHHRLNEEVNITAVRILFNTLTLSWLVPLGWLEPRVLCNFRNAEQNTLRALLHVPGIVVNVWAYWKTACFPKFDKYYYHDYHVRTTNLSRPRASIFASKRNQQLTCSKY